MRVIQLIAGICIFGFSASAQPPKTYAETKREQDWKKYQEDYIEGTRYNRNTPSSGTGNSSDNSAAQALADQWRRNSGRRTTAEQKEWEKNAAAYEQQRKAEAAAQQEKARKLQQDIAAFNAQRAGKEATRKNALDKNIATYSALGFNAQEADRFASALTDYPDGSRSYVLDEERDAAQRAIEARRQYNTIKDKATYKELAELIPKMHAASLTSMQAWQDLAKRFPEKQAETEEWELYAMPAIFERHTSEHPGVKDAQEKATERFFELFSRQPAAAINAVKAFKVDYYHPLYSSGMYNKMNTDEGRRWAEVMLLGTSNYSSHNRRDQWRKEMFESSWSVAYWKKKTNADWMELADMANLSLITAFERLANASTNWVALGSGKKGAPRGNNFFGTPYQFLWEEIADLAAAGEPSCMNAYGFYLASNPKSSGKDHKRGLKLLQQAIDSGVMWAPINMLFLAESGVADAPSKDSALAQADRVLSRATPHQRYQIAYELKRRVEMKYIDPLHAHSAASFAEQAAKAGHIKATTLYTQPDWIDIGVKPGMFVEKDWGKKYEGLVVSGQRTIFTSWPSAVAALPHFKSFTRDSLHNKDVIAYRYKETLLVLPRTNDFLGYFGSLLLPSTRLSAYTFKMNFSMIQNPMPDGFFGIGWRGPRTDTPPVYFMVNPARRLYYFGSGGDGHEYKTYNKSQVAGKGSSTAINTWNSQYYSSNEIGVERQGNLVKLIINGSVVETVDISPYPKVFDDMSHVGYGYGDGKGKFTAWIRDFFVSVKEREE